MGKAISLPLSHIFILLLSGLLVSCSNAMSGVGKRATLDQQLAVTNSDQDLIVWDRYELAIHYKMIDGGTSLTFSGSIQLKDRLLHSFPVVAGLLNQDRVATSRHIIKPNLLTCGAVEEYTSFSRQITKDADTVSIAFS